jgi:RNA ligase (TIGR02306 family)
MTEKLHGSFCGVGIVPQHDADPKHWLNRCVVFSKGLGSQGLCLLNTENNAGNAYIRALQHLGVFERLVAHVKKWEIELPLFLLGEVYGPGIQDGVFTYGRQQTDFRVFDVMVGYRGDQSFQMYDVARMVAHSIGVETVPEIYRGPFSVEALAAFTNGHTTLAEHMREGVVVKPTTERTHPELGRVILKSVSEAYLLRKESTEYN